MGYPPFFMRLSRYFKTDLCRLKALDRSEGEFPGCLYKMVAENVPNDKVIISEAFWKVNMFSEDYLSIGF